jgi:hypothetical protein
LGVTHEAAPGKRSSSLFFCQFPALRLAGPEDCRLRHIGFAGRACHRASR